MRAIIFSRFVSGARSRTKCRQRLSAIGYIIALLWPLMFAPLQSAEAANSAVIIMYHRFDEGEFPSTNTTIEQLETHINELTSGNYNVLPVADIVKRMIDGQPLPDRTVGITIDDAYRSIYTVAWPRFKAAGLPFTVFAATAHLDQGSSNHMTWDQLRELRNNGVDVGHHTISHLHMPVASDARLEKEISGARERYRDELNYQPGLFAYPYGEASTAVIKKIKQAGFIAAFGQHSGVVGNTEGMFYLPRFAMNEKYGDLNRLKLAINALPLAVTDITPADHFIDDGTRNPPAMGFTINAEINRLEDLSCFLSHAGRAKVERLGPTRLEVRTDTAFPKGRTRLNCTMPGPNGRWRWYGRQFYKP